MSASEDDLRDRINAADKFRLTACKDYNTKLDALASTGAEAQEIERLRTVCEDAKIRYDRVKAGGQFVQSVDEALAILPAGAPVVVDPNRVPLTVQEVQRIPEAEGAILVKYAEFGELNTVHLDDIVSVDYLAAR